VILSIKSPRLLMMTSRIGIGEGAMAIAIGYWLMVSLFVSSKGVYHPEGIAHSPEP
jgi:hypothetical protein